MENILPTWSFDPITQTLKCSGAWTILNLSANFESKLLKNTFGAIKILDVIGVTQLDMAGAFFLLQLIAKWQIKTIQSREEQQKLLALVQQYPLPSSSAFPKIKPPWLARLGEWAYNSYLEMLDYLIFAGEVFCYIGTWCAHPSRILWRNTLKVIEIAGYFSTPIIGLLSFLIGIVLAYQMGIQLENYGANIYVVNLLGISILREFAPLMTAIIVAGRTGSAFTAELGTMKVNQEIDALTTMGVKPIEYLVAPKVIGLLIAMPLLSMWAVFTGLLGGMIMSKVMLGITFQVFWHQFQEAITVRQLWIGLMKTPVFAFIVASIGCFQGFSVELGAASVGLRTTRSVVQSLFLIIVADAFFSILLSYFHA